MKLFYSKNSGTAMFWCLLLVGLITSPGYAQTPFQSLNYLYSIQGSQTIGGIHNRQPNSNPSQYTNQLYSITGVYPGLWSSDFQFEPSEIANRQTMINQAITEWNNGAMINLMWHACNPALGEPCYWDSNGVLSSLSDPQWNELITNGTPLNNAWKSRMDDVAYYLQQLEDAGVEVFFRPLHEMNQGMFWWAGRPGPNGTAKLYQITHDYFTYDKGLTNLIWVWNLQDFSSLSSDLNNYDPGWNYWDVLTLDMYWSDGQGYSTSKYNAMVNKAAGKPIGIGECEDLPAANLLSSQPLWTFFMGWSELTFQSNSNEKIQNIFWAGNVITLNEMPGWSSGGGGTSYHAVPGSFGAEEYSNMSGIQTETTTDDGGGLNVSAIDAGDWLTYNIDVASAGTYTVSYRVASLNGGGAIRLEQAGGGTVYGTINVPSTGGWQAWTTISHDIQLSAGQQQLGLAVPAGGFNINWIDLSSGGSGGGGSPIYVQAESYSNMSGVQTETTSDVSGGQNVGWIDAGDWMTYDNVNVPSSGAYTIAYRVASQSGGGTLQLEQAGGGTVYGTINIPSTGGWQTWTTIYQTVTLNAGTQSFGIKANAGGWNFNWWSLTPASGSRTGDEQAAIGCLSPAKPYPNPFETSVTIPLAVEQGEAFSLKIYNLSGELIGAYSNADAGNEQYFIWRGTGMDGHEVPNGIYYYRLVTANDSITGKLVKGK